jgi:hypothetical protein
MVLMATFAAPHFSLAGQFDGVGSTLAPGKIALSAGYWYQEDKWKADHITYTATSGAKGATLPALSVDNFKTASNQGYAQGAVGIFNGWEGYLRVGGGDINGTDFNPFFTSDKNFSDSFNAFTTVGINGTFYQDKMFAIGPFGQFTYYLQDYEKTSSASSPGNIAGIANASGPMSETVTIKDYYTIRAGFAGAVKLANFTVYGGPFWNYARAKLSYNATFTGAAAGVGTGTINLSADTTLKNKDDLGGFLGVKVPITKIVSIAAEGQYTSVWAAGVRIIFSF